MCQSYSKPKGNVFSRHGVVCIVCIIVVCAVKEYYTKCRDNSLCEVFAPHLHIYLDAPVKVLRERINKRNRVMHSLLPVD